MWDATGSGTTKGEYAIISGRINDIAWDGDSQRIIAVGDGRQRFGHCITADSGNSVGEISGHSAQVNAVSIRQQRPLRAATAGDDKTLVFYHGAPFKFNTSVRDKHSNYIYGVGFSPDGNHLVSVGGDRKIWLYDGKTGEVKGEVGDASNWHKGSIFGVAWAKDSRKIVTASADRTVKIWDVEAGKAVQTWILGEEGKVSVPDQQVGVVWPGGRSDGLVISLSLSGDFNYFAEGTQESTRTVAGHQKNITALTTAGSSSSQPALYTGSYEGRICSWDISTGTATQLSGEGHSNIISGLTCSPSASHPRIYSVAWDDSLRSIDINASTFTGTSTKLPSQPTSLAATSEGVVLVGHASGTVVTVYDSSGSEIGDIAIPDNTSPTSLAASGTTAAIGLSNSSVNLYTVSSSRAPKLVSTIEKASSSSPITALAFTPDGSLLACGDSSGKISVFRIAASSTLKAVADTISGSASPELVTNRWTGHTAKVTSIAWNTDGEIAVSGSLDTNIHVWSLKDPGKRVKVGNAHKEGVNGVAFIGIKKFVSAGADAAVKVWVVEGVE